MKKIITGLFAISLTCLCFATDPKDQSVKPVDNQQESAKEVMKQEMLDFAYGARSELPTFADLSLLTPAQQMDYFAKLKEYIATYSTTGWNYLGAYGYASVVGALNGAGLDPENVKLSGVSSGSSIYYYEP